MMEQWCKIVVIVAILQKTILRGAAVQGLRILREIITLRTLCVCKSIHYMYCSNFTYLMMEVSMCCNFRSEKRF